MAAETAVSMAGQHVLPKFLEAVNMLRDLPKEVAEIEDELESFQDFINDADKVAEAEEDDSRRDRIKKKAMRLREAAFQMEDAIDEYMICQEKQQLDSDDDARCAALVCEAVDYIKTLILRLQIANKIQDVNSHVQGLKSNYGLRSKLLQQRSNNSRGNQNNTWHRLRMDPLLVDKDEVVGLEGHMHVLKNWLMKGREDRSVISVVGIPGVGKTTLAKQVFDKVHGEFECHALITVSQSYTPEGLLRDMLQELCREKMEDPSRYLAMTNRRLLIEEVRKQLHNKRYVVLFDDVWNEKFWDDVDAALIDDKNKSRILITTRYEKVADFGRRFSFVEVHKLEEPLSEEESLSLFCKKAFKYGSDGLCPEQLKDMSLEIVRKCKCLPLAIVAIGGLLSQKDESAPEWRLFSTNLSLQLGRNSEINSVAKILSLSYDDLPYNLRSCLLYFGMYPEDYEVKSGRLIRQWIAEGFVKHEEGKTLEEVAQQHLRELIARSLVQVSSFTIDGKIKGCRVHDSIHEMIRGKIRDTRFCQHIDEHNQLVSSGIVRRLTISTESNYLIGSIERSHVRSILVFTELSEQFLSGILAKHMSLKVLDFEQAPMLLDRVPENLGSLIHLKYLSLRNTWIQSLPKFIGKLQNLETLDIRQTFVSNIPKEISKLIKLRHLLSEQMYFNSLEDMTSLQKLSLQETENDGMVIRQLGKLKQLRSLSLMITNVNFNGELENALCSSINEMQFLEKLHIHTIDEVIELQSMSTPSALRKLCLNGKLKEFPNWISRLQNLVKLSLMCSQLTNDPLESIQDLPSLLFLSFTEDAYEGFQRLKELELQNMFNLDFIFIDRGAMHSLQRLRLKAIVQLKTVPSGIQYLEKLQVLEILLMPDEFKQRIDPNGGQEHWMIKHVPHVHIPQLSFRILRPGKFINKRTWSWSDLSEEEEAPIHDQRQPTPTPTVQ